MNKNNLFLKLYKPVFIFIYFTKKFFSRLIN
jgi:hypothetical protein